MIALRDIVNKVNLLSPAERLRLAAALLDEGNVDVAEAIAHSALEELKLARTLSK